MKMFQQMCCLLILTLLLTGCGQSYIDLFPESPAMPRESSVETTPKSSTEQNEAETMPDLTIEVENDLQDTVEITAGVYDTADSSVPLAEAKFTTGYSIDEDTPLPLQKYQSYRCTIPGTVVSSCSGDTFYLKFTYTKTDDTTQSLGSIPVTKQECATGEVFRVSTWAKEEGKAPTIITQG